MRLLNVKTGELEDVAPEHDRSWPSYTILSHTWGKEEVSLQDLSCGHADELAGYEKLLQCCAKSKAEGFEYAWIDTCCIDKTSSAELSEAINSMFAWYSQAQVCYAYLRDVDGLGPDRPEEPGSSFRKSRWFRRGWTLQELLAPIEVVFLNRNWVEIGTKASLAPIISDITRIAVGALSRPLCGLETVAHTCQGFSVAQKMSWAALRETTRAEDRAYSLLGLFGVNMPLLYGEGGEKAFVRLQREIMRQSSDDSIFAWSQLGGERCVSSSFEEMGRRDFIAWRPELFYSGFVLQRTAAARALEAHNKGATSPLSRWSQANDSCHDMPDMATAYEEDKHYLSLSAPVLGFSDFARMPNARLFRILEAGELPDSELWSPDYPQRELNAAVEAEIDDTLMIAVLNCCFEFARVGIILKKRENGTYYRVHMPTVVFVEGADSELPRPQVIRVRHREGVGDACAAVPPKGPYSQTSHLDFVQLETDGYSRTGTILPYAKEVQIRPAAQPHTAQGLDKLSVFVPAGACVAFLYRHQDGYSARKPNVVLAIRGVTDASFEFLCFGVRDSQIPCGAWARDMDQRAGWQELEAGATQSPVGDYTVRLNTRKAPLTRYVFVSLLSIPVATRRLR